MLSLLSMWRNLKTVVSGATCCLHPDTRTSTISHHQNVNNQSFLRPRTIQWLGQTMLPSLYHMRADYRSLLVRETIYIPICIICTHCTFVDLEVEERQRLQIPWFVGRMINKTQKKLALTLRFQTRIIAHASSPTFWISSASCCAHQASRRRSSVAIIRDLLTVILVHVVFVAMETSGECVLAQTCVTRNTALSHWRRLCGPVTANTRAHPHTECINQWLWVERCIASYCWNCCVEDLGLGWDWGVTTVGKDLCLLTVALC